MGPQNNYNSDIKDYWSQITRLRKNTERVWNIARFTKMWHRDIFDNGKITPIELLDTVLP